MREKSAGPKSKKVAKMKNEMFNSREEDLGADIAEAAKVIDTTSTGSLDQETVNILVEDRVATGG
jgi:hypothetical protein